MNKAIFIGRVGGDAELHYTPGGKAVASFSMALDNGKDSEGNKRQPTWVKATLWEKRAESLAQYITKGKLVAVEGPVGAEAWVDKQSGEAKCKIVITVREFEFCGGTKAQESDESQQGSGYGRSQGGPDYDQAPARDSGEITDDDIPF